MKNFLKISLMSLNLLSLGAIACDVNGHSGFLPENKLNIPVGLKGMGGISQVQFNQVMDKITAIYTPIIAKTGRKFVIDRLWNDGTVNAYADQNTPGVDKIHMFGGLARHSETTVDAMALVGCHEIGHHIGGAPRKVDPLTSKISWAANEGQSDYWGAMKCLRNYFEGDDNSVAIKGMIIPSSVITQCQMIFKNADELATCERVSMAGLALGRLLSSIMSDKVQVSFTTPDKTVVTKMFDSHPKAQCRLDTFFQASLCDHGFEETVSNTDVNIGVCSIRNGDQIGNRPLCWFKP